MLLEVCVDSRESAIEAEKGGAQRIELCSALLEGGLTPSPGFLKVVKSLVKIPVFVMIRPRGGDFLYTEDELKIMETDMEILRDFGADGFVTGALTRNGQVDQEQCQRLIRASKSLPVTFHRAFDVIRDPFASLEVIRALGFSRILSSGQKGTAFEGRDLLRRLVQVQGDLIIMGGAGIGPENVGQLIKDSNLKEIHASAKKKVSSTMETGHVNEGVQMGSGGQNENDRWVTDSEIVGRIVQNSKYLL